MNKRLFDKFNGIRLQTTHKVESLKLANRIWHSRRYRDYPSLKRTRKYVKICYSVF